MKTFYKSLTIVLAVLMVFSVLPMSMISVAADEVPVATATEFNEAITGATTDRVIKLTSDITFDTPMDSNSAKKLYTIYLQGHTLTYSPTAANMNKYGIYIRSSGTAAPIIDNVGFTTGGFVNNSTTGMFKTAGDLLLRGYFEGDVDVKNGATDKNVLFKSDAQITGSVSTDGRVVVTAASLNVGGNINAGAYITINAKSTLTCGGTITTSWVSVSGNTDKANRTDINLNNVDLSGKFSVGSGYAYDLTVNGSFNADSITSNSSASTTDFANYEFNGTVTVGDLAMRGDNTGLVFNSTVTVNNSAFIVGGTFNAAVNFNTDPVNHVVIQSGTFSQDVSADPKVKLYGVCAPNGSKWTVTAADSTEPVCKIGGIEYNSLNEAEDAAVEGDTIKLIKDIYYMPGTVYMTVAKNDLTVDLCGFNITDYSDTLFYGEVPHNGFSVQANRKFTLTSSGAKSRVTAWVSQGNQNYGIINAEKDNEIIVSNVALLTMGTSANNGAAIRLPGTANTEGVCNKLDMDNVDFLDPATEGLVPFMTTGTNSPYGIQIVAKTVATIDNCSLYSFGAPLSVSGIDSVVNVNNSTLYSSRSTADINISAAATVNLTDTVLTARSNGNSTYITNAGAVLNIYSTSAASHSSIDAIGVLSGTVNIYDKDTFIGNVGTTYTPLNINSKADTDTASINVYDGTIGNGDNTYAFSTAVKGTEALNIYGGSFKCKSQFATAAHFVKVALGSDAVKAYSDSAYTTEVALADARTLKEVYFKQIGATLNLDLNNSSVTVTSEGDAGSNVTAEAQMPIENGTPVTLTANVSAKPLLFWTEDGKVRSEEPTYSFTMNGARNIDAVFTPGVGEGSIVIYRNTGADTQQILGYETYLTADLFTEDLVSTAYCYGKNFDSWDKNVDDIKALINVESVIYVDAVFTDIAATYTVTVNGGIITEGEKIEYNTDDKISITATDTANFKCWTDANGVVISTDATFNYNVGSRSVVITAQSTLPSGAQIDLTVDDDADEGKLKIYNSYYLPEGMTVVDVGLIYTKTTAATLTLEDVNGTTIKATHLGATGKQVMQIFNTISNTSPVTLCGYIVYTDSEGTSHTLYSSVYTK